MSVVPSPQPDDTPVEEVGTFHAVRPRRRWRVVGFQGQMVCPYDGTMVADMAGRHLHEQTICVYKTLAMGGPDWVAHLQDLQDGLDAVWDAVPDRSPRRVRWRLWGRGR